MNKKQLIVAWVIIILFIYGCATPGSKKYLQANTPADQELMPIEREIKFGHFVDAQVQNEYMVLDSLDLQTKIEPIFYEIVANCDRKELKFNLKILNTSFKNAFAAPGGYVYITTGLLDELKNKDELAGILAHEIGHVCARHPIKALYEAEAAKNIWGIVTLTTLLGSGDANFASSVSDLTAYIAMISLKGYSRSNELQADSLAVKYCIKSGYDPKQFMEPLKRMQKEIEEETEKKIEYTLLSSHPPNEAREENVKKQIENLTGGGIDGQNQVGN